MADPLTMAWFRRRKRLDLGTYVAPEPQPEAPLGELVDEGMLIAASAVRLAVKNLIILGSVRDHLDYDPERYIAAAKAELLNLAEEKNDDATRIAAERDAASERLGRPEHAADYRSIDASGLERRREVSERLAARLRELGEDDGYARELAEGARETAWDEIAASLEAKLARAAAPRDEGYDRHREERLSQLALDLFHLEQERMTGD